MTLTRIRRNWVRAHQVAAVAAVAACFAPATAAAPALEPVSHASATQWAEQVWQSALAGADADTFALFDRLPGAREDGVAALESLRAAYERRDQHLESARKARQERLGEATIELAGHLEEDDLVKALRSAVEVHTLSFDKAAALADPSVSAAVTRAVAAAAAAEQEGRWLDAHELYYRLNLLFEEDGRYKQDIDRLSQRLVMLRLYAPQRLHDMRSAQLEREGEDPLPPFNTIGEDWRQKLEGINPSLIVRALSRASNSHVDGVGMADMLASGLRALRTFATTTDLAECFPGLANQTSVQAFLDGVNAEIARVEARGGRANYFDLTETRSRISQLNDETVSLPEEALLHEFGNGAMSRLDEFSGIIWPDEIRRFQRSTQGRFTGVGIQISLDDAQQLLVVTPLEGTPAQRAGIKPGDIIRAVDGESTLGITLSQAVERITGDRGTEVVLSIEREGNEAFIDFPLVRDVIPIYSVKGWRRSGAHEDDWDWYIDPDNHIGYVRLTQFTEETTAELRRAIRQMSATGLDGLILDLRFNPGGLLTEAVGVANVFVNDGLIVSQHDAQGARRDVQRAQPGAAILTETPVVVLVNEGSASASEIVAGCLQDYKRAVVIGARSFGKGSVQNVYDIAHGAAALKLTTQYYQLPSGRLIHRRPGQPAWGVEPDLVIDMLPSQMSEALVLRQDADVLILGADEAPEDADDAEKRPDPDKLLEGIDTQLESALLLLRSQSLPRAVAATAANHRGGGLEGS